MQSIIAEYRGSFLRDIVDYWRYIFAFCRQERTINRQQRFSRQVNFSGKTVSDSYHTYDRPEVIYSIANVH